ncbi:MAG: peptidoglycan-binding protein [Tabrizicola sp.]|jgi:lysozyme|nr:peptidoglycan-binding protein [Tabrizicola sp.]
MQTSAKGRADLKLHEGEVLKAYRDPVGILTIGVGLTSASGVIKVRPGMVITAEESDRLLTLALRRNYEPRVAKVMPKAKQHEFDGAVGFDFNTGAIHRASWVKAWMLQNWVQVEAKLKLWNKGGGKVLPGLVRRREAEYQLIRFGRYESDKGIKQLANPGAAKIALPLTPEELVNVIDGFERLGFRLGASEVLLSEKVVRAFQKKYDLTVDGILGRATLSTLQRALDARGKAKPTAAVGAASGGVSVADPADIPGLEAMPWLTEAVFAGAALYALWLAWRYRDQIAAAVQSPLPRVAAFLRSF